MSKKKKKKTAKKDLFIVFMTIALILLLIVWVIRDNTKIKEDNNNNVVESAIDSFTKITVSDALDKIKKDTNTFIYIGYEGCKPCNNFANKLSDVIDDYKITVYYINYKEIDKDSKEWETLTSKYTKEQTITIKTEDDNTTSKTKTIGGFLKEEGYTPTFAIFKSGKIIDGNIGNIDTKDLKTRLEAAGYEK